MFPKGANKPPLDTAFSPGALVMYENDGVPLIAAIQSFKKQKYAVLNERGREVELVAARLHPLPGKLPAGLETLASKTEHLQRLGAVANEAASRIDMEEVWSFVVDDSKEYEMKALAELYYGKAELESYLALRLALLADRIFFRRNKESFEPRPKENIEELRKAEAARQRKIAREQATLNFFRERLANRSTPIPPEVEHNIELLEDLAAEVDGMDPQRTKEAKELLQASMEKLGLEISGSMEQRCYLLLERIYHFDQDTNLSLIRNRPPLSFPPHVVDVARALRAPSAIEECDEKDRHIRRDLTSWRTFTVDDVSTKDMDDALSLETTQYGFLLGIHITDVAYLIEDGTELDLEARRRATSIYCPDRTINMLPESLSERTLSLLPNEIRPCLSVLVEVDHDFKVLSSSICPSLIRSSERLTYDEMSARLENGDATLTGIYNIAMTWQAERIERGAIRVNKRDAAIAIGEDGDLRLVEIDEDDAARATIGEMMVLANSIMANFAARHDIPLIFRGQEPPDEDPFDSAAGVPAGPAHDYAVRSKLKRSSTSLSPIPHSGLGLDAYVQATSPIRRYGDLCNQRQIISFLRTGHAHYGPDELSSIMMETDGALATAGTINKETKRYWLLKYLKKSAQSRPQITATVIRTDLKNPLVELDEVYMPITVKADQQVKVGDVLRLKIVSVDPRYDYLKLEVIGRA